MVKKKRVTGSSVFALTQAFGKSVLQFARHLLSLVYIQCDLATESLLHSSCYTSFPQRQRQRLQYNNFNDKNNIKLNAVVLVPLCV